VEEIIDAFYGVRIDTYNKRKEHLVCKMKATLKELSNRAKFIQGLLNDQIDLRRKKNQEVDELLTAFGLDKQDDSFAYLRRMQTDSVTEENVEKIMKEKTNTEMELNRLMGTTVVQMWQNDLVQFEKQYLVYKTERENLQMNHGNPSSGKEKKVVSRKK
jgi:DNA gyrase/topoisomerase IV subunit A